MDRTPWTRNTAWAVGHSDYLQSHAPNDPHSSPTAPTTRLRPGTHTAGLPLRLYSGEGSVLVEPRDGPHLPRQLTHLVRVRVRVRGRARVRAHLPRQLTHLVRGRVRGRVRVRVRARLPGERSARTWLG